MEIDVYMQMMPPPPFHSAIQVLQFPVIQQKTVAITGKEPIAQRQPDKVEAQIRGLASTLSGCR